MKLILFLSLLGVTVAQYYGSGGRPKPNPPRPAGSGGTKCPAGWQLWRRSQGNWCVGLYIGTMNQPSAEQQCRNKGATLTGLQTNGERLSLAAAGLRMLQKHGLGDASIWLGARRKGSCARVNMCLPRETFFWTDKHTTGYNGFGWAAGQPDGVTDYHRGAQACAHQFIFPNGHTHPRWPGIKHGQLDDQYCQEGSRDPNTKLYACGKLATR